MLSYLFKLFIMLIFSILIIFFYYGNNAHYSNFDGYFIYIAIVSIFYITYKFFQLSSLNNKVNFTPIKIFGYFFVHLMILSTLFFYYNNSGFGNSLGNGIGFSFKILFYSLLPVGIILISIAFGQTSLKLLFKNYEEKSSNYKFLTGIGIGFFSFLFFLDIIGMLGFYNLYSVFSILAIFSILSYKKLWNLLKGIFSYKIECLNHNFYSKSLLEKINPKLLSTEFLFIVITLILSINLISIFRPFPIGWDDLGAYMNYAHLMANEGSIGFLGSIMSWQTFTGIGYMFENPTLAFFLNNVGGFVSVIVIALIVSEIFKKQKKTFINLGLLASTLFISMPMVVFQQAKDMKLDEGLLFVSIIPLYMLFDFYNGYKKIKLSRKEILKLFLVIGLLLGFAFTIKFTSLLLILAIGGVLFFTRLNILGFLGYLGIIFSVFTYGNLWSRMNVVTNFDDEFKTQFSLISLIIGITFLVTARVITKKRFRRFIPRLLALLFGIVIAVSPWAVNNMNQAGKIGLSEMLSGKSVHFNVDYSKIYSKKELEYIEKKVELSRGIDSSGTTTNEDYGRYFGYEKGINNYIKLPWNLTMQLNQGGEFTTIGFLFLALLPSLLLFLPFRKKYFFLLMLFMLVLEILIFIKTDSNLIEKANFSNVKQETINKYFINNKYVLENKFFNKNIYNIKFSNYVSDKQISELVENSKKIQEKIHNKSKIDAKSFVEKEIQKIIGNNKNLNPQKIFNEKYKNKLDEIIKEFYDKNLILEKEKKYKILKNEFYKELKNKVISEKFSNSIKLLNTKLIKDDTEKLKNLRERYQNYYIFKSKYSEWELKKEIEEKVEKNIDVSEEKKVLSLWVDNGTINQRISDFFASFKLPTGYAIILLLFLVPFAFLIPTVKKEKLENLFKINLVFTVFYTFLWGISAFGIVWYGIVMYFNFILMIIFGAYYLGSHDNDDNRLEKQIKFFGTLIFFGIICIYLFMSVFPYSFNNLKKASYKEYKLGKMTVAESPFKYHREYLPILFELNILDNKKEEFIKNNLEGKVLELYNRNNIGIDIVKTVDFLNFLVTSKSKKITKENKIIAKKSIQNLYSGISNVKKEYKNNVGIYRIGTFLKYHISENNKRLYGDSLVSQFEKYFYDENSDITVERMKKIGLEYLLVDLNAATIDQDPRHNLTKRYEELIQTFTSAKLKLIDTDSICLRMGLENYKKQKDLKIFTVLAGVNYDSYNEEGKKIGRSSKRLNCYQGILTLIKDKQVNDNSYSFLQYLIAPLNNLKTENEKLNFLVKNVTPGFKVLFKIK